MLACLEPCTTYPMQVKTQYYLDIYGCVISEPKLYLFANFLPSNTRGAKEDSDILRYEQDRKYSTAPI